MRRARANIETLIPRLAALGWTFGEDAPDWEGCWTPPPPDAPALVDAMEGICGPIPLALRAFYEIVGGVDFRGEHPEWLELYDPLMVYPCRQALDDLRAGPPFCLPYAPDFLVKEGISGVGLIYVEVPNGAADAPPSFEDQELPISFVQSLRNAFRWGGFQGLVGTAEEFGPDLTLPPTDIAALTQGLLPL